ncbi:HD domain-containing protein [Micrococcus luteus]|uniref:HD domain-containing protein n=1 Tax=Micrococcus luteus TaxID=1270 RepID=UPI0036743715
MSTHTQTPATAGQDTAKNPAWSVQDPSEYADDPRAQAFATGFPERPIPAQAPVSTGPVCSDPSTGHDDLWRAIIPETRARANDFHLPIVAAYAERLCAAYPQADREVVMTAVILHDTGWAHVAEDRIVSEGFQSGDWRKAAIRYEHEREGVEVARRVLPPLGHDAQFVERVSAIIDGHDTRPVAFSLEDALVRDCDRLWRFERAGMAFSCMWFGMDPSEYADRLEAVILPELITQAAVDIARADLARQRALLRTDVIR